jgi:regulator of protease activity HflC (stomatin/prohibitin superfamily)
MALFENLFRWLRVGRTERVALIRDGRFERLLGPGRHFVWTLGAVVELERYDVSSVFETVAPGDLVPLETSASQGLVVADGQLALVRFAGVFHAVLGAGVYRLWTEAGDVAVERVDTRAPPGRLEASDRLPSGIGGWAAEATASADQAVVLLRDGLPVERLAPGRYRTWAGGPWALRAVSLALDELEVATQDLVTRDEVPVRVKAAVAVRVVDPVRALVEPKHRDQAYGAVQLALREVLASRTLDQLLDDREALSGQLLSRIREALPKVGLAVEAAWVKDVLFSAETKALLGAVTLARKEAEALAIRRREEVAATRSQANTAKLLEAMTEIASRIDKITVVGGLDSSALSTLRILE